MFRQKTAKWHSVIIVGILLMTVLAAGCSKQQSAKPPQEVAVKAMKVIQKDTPVTYEFVGEIEAKDEVKISANVSGTIIDKMVKGGDTVYKGQPLFRIDSRQYQTTALNSQALLAEAEASLSRIRRDVARYRSLAAQNAIAEQVLDNIVAEERQAEARVDAYRASVQKAGNDLGDTVVLAPIDGKIDMKDLSVGTYVQAGSTVLATMSSSGPVRVKFSMSETEYLSFAKRGNGNSPAEWFGALGLILGDGSQYPLTGAIEQVDKGLAQNTGTLTLKAVFQNPQHILVPGMFGRVVAQGGIRQGAMMIPQRALQQILGKNFVTVVDADGKAESRPIKLGPQIGTMLIVEEGLNLGETVVVEGFQKAQPGTPLNVTMIAPEELQSPVQK